jgi:predicted RNA-binding protein with RPS1 domain
MDEYTSLVLDRSRAGRRSASLRSSASAEKPQRRRPAQSQKELQDIDIKIGQLRQKISVLDEALADHSIYAEAPKKAADFAKLRAKLAADLDSHETLWLEAHDS